MLQLVPETKGVLDDVTFLVEGGALEQGVDERAEVDGLAGNRDDPRVAGVSEEKGEGLEAFGVLLLGVLADVWPQLDDAGQEGLDGVEVVVDIARLAADGAQAVGGRLDRGLVADGRDDDVQQGRVDDATDGDLTQPRCNALE